MGGERKLPFFVLFVISTGAQRSVDLPAGRQESF